MKLDVVYPLSNMSKGAEDSELRYSLRSLNDQPWVRNVFTVGHKPAWLKNTFHIPHKDQWTYEYKDKNIIKKMLAACADDRVSDPFIANSDDQYWLKIIEPQDMLIPPRENPPQMQKGSRAKPYPFPISRNHWVMRQMQTVRFLGEKKRCTTCFDGHVPYLIDKQRYMKTMCQIPWEIGHGFLIVVYHGWNWESLSNGTKIEDRDGVLVRIKNDTESEQIESITQNALFLNHNNRAMTIRMQEFLRKRFPNPSRWE